MEPDFWEVTWQIEGESFEAMRSLGKELSFKEHEQIFAEGDAADGMYLVLEGYALVVLLNPETDEQETLSIIPPGQSFGELALLNNQPRLATVVAGTGDLRVLKITTEGLAELEKSGSRRALFLYKKLARTLAEQLIQRAKLGRSR